MQNTHSEHAVEAKEFPVHIEGKARSWVKPTMERLPLKNALTGRAPNRPFQDASQTYPS